MVEIWKSHPRHPWIVVSTEGAILNTRTGRRLGKGKDKHGYHNFKPDQHTPTEHVHRAVLETWLRPLAKGEQTRHLNGFKGDNSLENLAYGTARDNREDRKDNDTWGHKLTEADVREIRRLLAVEAGTGVWIAKRFGITEQMVRNIKYNRCWQHV